MIFLNKDVEREVVSYPELYIAWRLVYSSYDPDIDPLHNPDWVKHEQEKEVKRLEDLKLSILKIKNELLLHAISGKLMETR